MKLTEKERFFLTLVASGEWTVTKSGKVKNNRTGRYLGSPDSWGYPQVHKKDLATGKVRTIKVHKLVWLVFKGPVPKGYEINHEDGNKQNARLSNFNLKTPSGNVRHAIETGLRVALKGGAHGMSKLHDKEVVKLRRLWKRHQGTLMDFRDAHCPEMSTTSLAYALQGKTFKHLPGASYIPGARGHEFKDSQVLRWRKLFINWRGTTKAFQRQFCPDVAYAAVWNMLTGRTYTHLLPSGEKHGQ